MLYISLSLQYDTSYLHNTILQRHNTENLKQIFLEKELRGLSLNYHIHVSVSDLHIPTIGLPILLQENMWADPGNNTCGTDPGNNTCGKIGTGAAQFLFWVYTNGTSVAVQPFLEMYNMQSPLCFPTIFSVHNKAN